MTIDRPGGAVIALDVGGTSVKSGLVDTTPAVVGPLRQIAIDNRAGAAELLAIFAGIVAGHAADLGGRPLLGVAAALPNPFDYDRGVSLMRHKYAALYGADLGAALRAGMDAPDLPVAFRNDAEAAVIGEARFGAGQARGRLLGITLGTGLGACFVAHGAPVRGGPGVPPGGELWEQPFRGATADDWFSIRGLQARLGAQDIRAAAGRAAHGDEAARAAFAGFGADLAAFLAPFMAAFRADALLVLGGLAGAGDHFLPAVRAGLPAPALVGARGAHAALLGAADLLTRSPSGAP